MIHQEMIRNFLHAKLLLVLLMLLLPSRITSFAQFTSTKSTHPCTLHMSSMENERGKLMVLGGTGFLGQTVAKRALLEGYSVTCLSRRGSPPETSGSIAKIDYRAGDARDKDTISSILDEGGYCGIIHCVGLLLDDSSGLGQFNILASGSGSIPDKDSTYDTITRVTAFNAMDAAIEYAEKNNIDKLPFYFTSAAEAGWPDVPGGTFVETTLAPDWLRRYLEAKRKVEKRLLAEAKLRPIIARPSLIYSLDRPASFPSVGAFFAGNRLGLPFVDRPVTAQALACAIVRAISRKEVRGVLRYREIDDLSQ
mmetsp:Transcript_31680/g.48578  ORF Transcript_31680/g.48578 Transcript_31680/m.48578 type:complete len:309 (-) Transcript_31680:97-1023(-)